MAPVHGLGSVPSLKRPWKAFRFQPYPRNQHPECYNSLFNSLIIFLIFLTVICFCKDFALLWLKTKNNR